MNTTEFEQLFAAIVNEENNVAPYDNPEYLDYTKLNHSRYSRWIKKGVLNPDLIKIIQNTSFTNWTIITEPWCGDAAHSVPFLVKLAAENPNITLNIELRDSAPHRIDNYLTNGAKSIPVFIFNNGETEKIWGPRPLALQSIFDELKSKETDFEELKRSLQKWYNDDKGETLQAELVQLLR